MSNSDWKAYVKDNEEESSSIKENSTYESKLAPNYLVIETGGRRYEIKDKKFDEVHFEPYLLKFKNDSGRWVAIPMININHIVILDDKEVGKEREDE